MMPAVRAPAESAQCGSIGATPSPGWAIDEVNGARSGRKRATVAPGQRSVGGAEFFCCF
jgi:hypothetical protein